MQVITYVCRNRLEKVHGANEKGQQSQEPLRGKRVSEREGFQRLLKVFRGFFSEALSETLSETDFPLDFLSPVAPDRFAP